MTHEPVKPTAPSVEELAPEAEPADASERYAESARDIREALLKTFFTGLSWTAAARVLTSIGTAARYIVFVRLLRPFDFGVIASATLVCSALIAATETRYGAGAHPARRSDIDPYLDTLFTT